VFGVASAGIALALQEVITSFAGWLSISTGRFYKIGDRISFGQVKGDVIDIGLLRTTIMEIGDWIHGDQYNGKIVSVPNNSVFKEPVYNYSGDFPFLWDEIQVPIKYGSDLELTRELIGEAIDETVSDYVPLARDKWKHMVKKYMIENASVEPIITIEANENWVTYSIRYTVDYKSRRTTKDMLFRKILAGIDETGGRIEIASARLHNV
jgi:small-conductance mechanosensitive channel